MTVITVAGRIYQVETRVNGRQKLEEGNSCDDIFTVGKSFSVFLFKCDVYLVEGFVLAKKRKYVYVSCIWEGIIFFVTFFKRDVDLLRKVVSEFLSKIHVTVM